MSTTTTTTKTTRAARPDHQPKRAKTAYQNFKDTVTDEFKEKHPGVDSKELTRLIRAHWDSLTDEERTEKYSQCMNFEKEERERFERETTEWERDYPEEFKSWKERKSAGKRVRKTKSSETSESNSDSEDRKSRRKTRRKKKAKRPGEPKRARTSYIYFTTDVRPKFREDYPDLKPTELISKMADAWRKLPAAKKQKYEEMSARDKERHEKEQASFELKDSVRLVQVTRVPVEDPNEDVTTYEVPLYRLEDAEAETFKTMNHRFVEDSERSLMEKITSGDSFGVSQESYFRPSEVMSVFWRK